MSSIKEHIDVLFTELHKIQLDGHITESNEFVAFNDIELAVNELRKACEQTKDLDRE